MTSPDHPTIHTEPDGLATIDDIKAKFRVSEATVHNWIRAGVPSLRIGRTRRFIIAEVIEWARSNANGDAA